MRIAPKGVEEGKRLRGRGEGVERKRSGEEKNIHFKNFGQGGVQKKSLVFRKERLFFYLKKNDNYGSAPKSKINQNDWFSQEPWAPPLKFLTPMERGPPGFGST